MTADTEIQIDVVNENRFTVDAGKLSGKQEYWIADISSEYGGEWYVLLVWWVRDETVDWYVRNERTRAWLCGYEDETLDEVKEMCLNKIRRREV